VEGRSNRSHGADIEEQKKEVARLRLMIEELRTKLRELMAGCKDRGVGDVFMEVADCVGLTPILQQMSVFERLYADAKDRVRRLEKLREKVKRESAKLGNLIPESEPFLSVMDALEQDQVHALRDLAVRTHTHGNKKRADLQLRLPWLSHNSGVAGKRDSPWAANHQLT